MNPIIWLIGLGVFFLMLDEWQRLRRRVRSLEDRLASFEEKEGGPVQ